MTDLLRRAWDALDAFKQAYPENWHDEDEQVLKDLMSADFAAQQPEPVAWTHSMTLRDWFAGQALAACYDYAVRKGANEGWPENWRYCVAQEAYEMADEMLAAREVKP